MTTASGSQPTDGPPDNACEVNLTGADPLVRDSQPDRGAIIRRYLRWRWGSLAKVTDEAREKAEQDYDFWAAALRVVPPEGGPRPDELIAEIVRGFFEGCGASVTKSVTRFQVGQILRQYEVRRAAALRASGAGTRRLEQEVTLCHLTHEEATAGVCLIHAGDACLRQYAPVAESRPNE